MKHCVLIPWLLASILGAGRLPADDTVVSQDYPEVSCTSTEPLISARALQLAEETRSELAPLLNLGRKWRFPLHIHVVTPEDPLADRVHDEYVGAFLKGKSLEIDLVLPSSDPAAREAIQRECITALLWEKFFSPNQVFDTNTHLDSVPLWLAEGLREWINEDPDCVREAIVKRAALNNHTPTLAEITGWHELGPGRLYGLWQRAFCYYLVSSLVQAGPRRVNFQEWLNGLTSANPTSANYLFPTEAAWRNELLQSPERSLQLVYTWEQTSDEFDKAGTFNLGSPDGKQTRTCTLDDVASLHLDKVVIEAIDAKILLLTSLELRAHVSWRPIVALYRFALDGLASGKDPAQVRQLFAEARKNRDAEIARHQKIVDYLNWFEVTHDDNSPGHFLTYFSMADNLDRAQAPHPNPIRASLLQVESQFSSGN